MSRRMPDWLAEWLGVAPDTAGEGTTWQIETQWGWAPWMTLLAALAIVGWVVLWYSRESANVSRRYKTMLATLRLLAILVLAVMLTELLISLKRTGLPAVVVMVDRSASMATIDRIAASPDSPSPSTPESTRLSRARQWLLRDEAKLLKSIARRYQLLASSFAEDFTWHEGDVESVAQHIGDLTAGGDDGGATRIGAAVRQTLTSLRGTPPAAIVVLTDGVNTAGISLDEAAAYARRRGVPLYTIGIGNVEPPADLELADLLVDEVVFAGDLVRFEATLKQTALAGEIVRVRLQREGETVPVAEQEILLDDEKEIQTVRLAHRPTEVGDFRYIMEVELLKQETTEANNRVSRVVKVREEKVRVLFVQAYPNFEYRYLKHLLQRDTTVELDVVLQNAALEYAEADEAALPIFPVRREELFAYDVLIFGDVDPRRLSRSALSNIRRFVEQRGGGIIFIAGPRFLPWQYREIEDIAALLPIDLAATDLPDPNLDLEEGFVLTPTQLGLASPQMELGDTHEQTESIWPALPPLYWLLEISGVKPAARVLAEHPYRTGRSAAPLPAIILQYMGAGKVIFHATDETWRWRYRVGDVFFARYWIQTIRLLARSKLLGGDRGVELSTDRREYTQGTPAQVRVRFFDERSAPAADDGVSVLLSREGGQRKRITLRRNMVNRGVFEATLADLEYGNYRAVMVRPTTSGQSPAADFTVNMPPGELARLQMDEVALASAAQQSLGKFYRLTGAYRLLKDLPQGRQVPFQQLPPVVLWNRWWLLTAFVGLICMEWLLRKRKGLM